MNKYQEAVDNIAETNDVDERIKYRLALQELVDKATPISVHNSSVMANGTACWLCPKCKEFVYCTDKYCSNCGQRIEWR